MPVTESKIIQLALASDDLRSLHAWQLCCSACPEFQVVTTFQTGEEILYWIQRGICPEVLVLDEALGDMDLIGFMERLALSGVVGEQRPHIIILSSDSHRAMRRRLAELRPDVLLPKPCTPETLWERIHMVCRGNGAGVDAVLVELLEGWGLPAGSVVFQYLTKGVQYLLEEPAHGTYKAALLTMAGGEPGACKGVESAIRRTILRLDKSENKRYISFKNLSGFGVTKAGTPKQFLRELAEHVRRISEEE